MYVCVCVSLPVCFSICLFTVESYTREAGVRTLERRIGALCRAVAVKVAEHLRKRNEPLTSTSPAVKDGKEEPEMSETVDVLNVSNVTIPPNLPIVIDVAAVEDILGVGIC